MRKHLLTAIYIFCCSFQVFAQDSSKHVCPSISISGPEGIIKPGIEVRFKVVLSPIDSQNLTYEWSIDKGRIVNGQSTREISVDTSDIPEAFGPTAAELIVNVRIGGFPKGCEAKASDKYFVSTGIYDVFPIDEYGAISIDDEKARLDNLATQLSNNPHMKGYIVKSFLKGTSDRAVVLRANRIKKFLFVYRRYPKTRYEILVCWSKVAETKLWLWPSTNAFEP